MFTVEHVKAAYQYLKCGVCKGLFYTEEACCPLTAVYLYDKKLSLLPRKDMVKWFNCDDLLVPYMMNTYNVDLRNFYMGFDHGTYLETPEGFLGNNVRQALKKEGMI